MSTVTVNEKLPLYHGRLTSREEYLDLPDDGFKYDMIDGVLYMSPSAFFEHNEVLVNFLSLLKAFIRGKKIGRIVSDTDIFLPDGGDVLRPDVSLVLTGNQQIIVGHIHGVPDLICEVLSKSMEIRDLGVKADRY